MLKKCPKCGSYSLEENLSFQLRMCLKTNCRYSEPLPREKSFEEKLIDALEKRISIIEERLNIT